MALIVWNMYQSTLYRESFSTSDLLNKKGMGNIWVMQIKLKKMLCIQVWHGEDHRNLKKNFFSMFENYCLTQKFAHTVDNVWSSDMSLFCHFYCMQTDKNVNQYPYWNCTHLWISNIEWLWTQEFGQMRSMRINLLYGVFNKNIVYFITICKLYISKIQNKLLDMYTYITFY